MAEREREHLLLARLERRVFESLRHANVARMQVWIEGIDGQPGMVEHLRRNSATLRQALIEQGLDAGPSRTQIVPVVVGGLAAFFRYTRVGIAVRAQAESADSLREFVRSNAWGQQGCCSCPIGPVASGGVLESDFP